MAEFDVPSYDYAPETYDYSSWYDQSAPTSNYDWLNDMSGMGFAGFGDAMTQPAQAELISEPLGPYGFDQSLASTPPGPNVGQGSFEPRQQEDDWMKLLGKAGLGMGVGMAGNALQGLFSGGGGSKKSSSGWAQSTTQGQQYKPEPLAPEPGTKASPLISGRPTQVRGSQGLRERRPTYGGFSMY